MSQVNLLPPEARDKLKARRITLLIGVAGGIIVLMLLGYWGVLNRDLAATQLEIQAQTATNSDLQGQVDELAFTTQIQAQAEEAEQIVLTALENEVSWSSSIRDVQVALPPEVGLTTFSGRIEAGQRQGQDGDEDAGALPPEQTQIGEIQFAGAAAGPTGAQRVARWLGGQNNIQGWMNPWLSDMTEEGAYTGRYSFQSTVDINGLYRTARGQGPTQTAEEEA